GGQGRPARPARCPPPVRRALLRPRHGRPLPRALREARQGTGGVSFAEGRNGVSVDTLAPHLEAPIEWGEIEEPRVPVRLWAQKDCDTFLVADAYGDVLGGADGLFLND